MTNFKLIKRSDFPQDFVFGVATAAYQIEGSALGANGLGMGTSHWDSFSATKGNSLGGDTGAHACDHYNRFEEDLDLVKQGGFGGYRFSFSWPRLIPNGTGAQNAEGFDYYDRLIDAMLARGIKPNGTLYHWDLPSALADKGGWMNRDIADWFADYAVQVAQRFGDRLDMLATINEPWCVSFLSHFIGAHAPGYRDIRATARSMHHVLFAHGKAIQALRAENDQLDLGIVLNLAQVEPADDSADTQWAVQRLDNICNRWFLDGTLKGQYPADLTEAFAPWMPENFQDDMQSVAAPMDWLGINYYTRELAFKAQNPAFPGIEAKRGDLPKTGIGWEVYPQGLGILMERIRTEYGNPRLYITENGMALPAPDSAPGELVEDQMRADYFDSHLEVCAQAIAKGSDLRGYFGWSLLDNFEWSEGYSQRFGLVHVDYETQKRTPKTSYQCFADLLKGD